MGVEVPVVNLQSRAQRVSSSPTSFEKTLELYLSQMLVFGDTFGGSMSTN